MNRGLILRILSRVALAEALLMLPPALVGFLYGDDVLIPYGVPVALLCALWLLLGRVKSRSKDFFAKEGFVSVSLAWILMSVFGALPFWLSGTLHTYIDGFFEAVSGFTATGATLLAHVDVMPKGLLFWRSFMHWIGGMGVLLFLLSITALAGDRSMHLLRAESPGPSVGKLTPRLRASAGITYLIYLTLTLSVFVLLMAGGMPLFDSLTNAFSIAGTGGFTVHTAGIMAYDSSYIEIVITVFMLAFGVNFSIYYLFLTKKPLEALKSEELRWYFGIFAVASGLICVSILPHSGGFLPALRLATFQSASIMSTTGLATADFDAWPALAQVVLFLLMCIGASAGSTGGGFKVARVALLLKTIRREVSRMLHPRSIGRIKFEGKTVETEVTHGVLVYLAVCVLICIAGVAVVSLDELDHVTTFSAVLTSLNNIGTGFSRVGPMGNYTIFSPLSKLTLSALMLIGRLEIFPMLMLFAPSVWRRG